MSKARKQSGTILPIYLHPHPMLREVAAPITQFDKDLHQTLENMQATLISAGGIGLAATQVGIKQRIFIANCEVEGEPGQRKPVKGSNFIEFINPEIISHSKEKQESEEGCLSIPLVFDIIKNQRHQEVTIKYQDRHGNEHEFTGENLWAACIQHELDHLNGKLFPDHLSRLKKDMFYKKYLKSLPSILREVTYPVVEG